MGLAQNVARLDDASSLLPQRLFQLVDGLPNEKKGQVHEIRLRLERPFAVNIISTDMLFSKNGSLTQCQDTQTVITSKEEINECFKKLCGYSVYSHQNEIINGFITVKNGHRAGICGTAVVENGKITGLRDISSINIRVAREINGAADKIFEQVFTGELCGILICGAPGSGKTTILRDLARQLSIRKIRVSVVDERGELAATYCGQAGNDMGPCCDILDGYPKGEGILIAVKCLAPDVIVCDEIGSEEEALAIQAGLNSGVCVMASTHATSLTELKNKKQIMRLIELGAFKYILFLHNSSKPCTIKEIVNVSDLYAENRRSDLHHDNLFGSWNISVPETY